MEAATVLESVSADELTLQQAVHGEVEMGLADPKEIAQSIREKYSDEWLQSALDSLLPWFVSMQLSHVRNTAKSSPGRSRAEKYRAAKWLAASVFVPGGGWKLQADLTYDEVLAVALHRREQAASMLASAERYTEAAALMKKHRAKKLGDLGDLLEELLNDE